MSKVRVEELKKNATQRTNTQDPWSDRLKDAEIFVRTNFRLISIVFGAIVLLVILVLAYFFLYLGPRSVEAKDQMFRAQAYFEADSLSRAQSGDGNNLGFEAIASQYANTPSGNLAHYYLGSIYLRKGMFQKAIDVLDKYTAKDDLTGSEALGMTGDAYSELKQYDKALEYYQKAADLKPNSYTSPMYLQKKGLILEFQKNYSKALQVYLQIKTTYGESPQGVEVDKFIARVKQHI